MKILVRFDENGKRSLVVTLDRRLLADILRIIIIVLMSR
jgi:hypothetical protein